MSRPTGGVGAVALLAGVFMAGVLSGAASMRIWSNDAPQAAAEPGPRAEGRNGEGRRPPRRSDDRFLKDLTERLDLSQDQRAQLSEVVSASRSRSDSLYHSIGPALREHLEETRGQIRELLTDEQRERFDAMSKERRRRGRSGRDSGRPGGGPPGMR